MNIAIARCRTEWYLKEELNDTSQKVWNMKGGSDYTLEHTVLSKQQMDKM